MKSFKALATLIYCILLIIHFAGCRLVNEEMHGTPPSYQNQDELIESSDDIIYGEVVKEYRAKKINISAELCEDAAANEDNMVLYTTFDIRVDEVIKGDLKPGQIIRIKQLGDKNNAQVSEISNAVGYFNIKFRYIFFLASFEDIIPGMPYETLSPTVGHLEIKGNTVSVKNQLFNYNGSKDELIKFLKEKVNRKSN